MIQKSYLTDDHQYGLFHVVLISQGDLLPPGVLVILSCLVFPGDQVDHSFPFFLFYHLFQEGPGDQ